jgi:hypothetical protein
MRGDVESCYKKNTNVFFFYYFRKFYSHFSPHLRSYSKRVIGQRHAGSVTQNQKVKTVSSWIIAIATVFSPVSIFAQPQPFPSALYPTACGAGADRVAAPVTIDSLPASVLRCLSTCRVAPGLNSRTGVSTVSCDVLIATSRGYNYVGMEAADGCARIVPYVTLPGCVLTVGIAKQAQNCSVG